MAADGSGGSGHGEFIRIKARVRGTRHTVGSTVSLLRIIRMRTHRKSGATNTHTHCGRQKAAAAAAFSLKKSKEQKNLKGGVEEGGVVVVVVVVAPSSSTESVIKIHVSSRKGPLCSRAEG